jgi:mono/diheme cytochrome c family protein
MRIGFPGVMFLAFWMVSCGQMGAPPDLGDMEAGGEPAEGGIAEVPNPSASMAKKAGKSLGEIQRGHEVYMLHCGECHRYKLPQDLDIDEWQTAVPKMISHAGLEAVDENAVLAYVVAVKMERGEE